MISPAPCVRKTDAELLCVRIKDAASKIWEQQPMNNKESPRLVCEENRIDLCVRVSRPGKNGVMEKMEELNAAMDGVGAWAKADSLPHPPP